LNDAPTRTAFSYEILDVIDRESLRAVTPGRPVRLTENHKTVIIFSTLAATWDPGRAAARRVDIARAAGNPGAVRRPIIGHENEKDSRSTQHP
jgi:hypothetical protein